MIQAVLFDLDGTLADTAADLGAALNRLLAEEGKPPVAYELIRPVASHGARGLIELGFGIHKTDPIFDDYRRRFLDHYEASFADLTTLFDGVNPLLQALTARGLKWGIVTNKPMRFTDRLVPALPWAVPPGVVVSGDTVGVPKPDPKPMLHAASQLGVVPKTCLYLGDAERDVEAARAAGMRAIIASYGYISNTDTPHTWGADGFIDHPEELLQHV
ncbi:phosphoglycolate phosphatase [Chitinivorax sp. B]|uniref:phosphoglycolate phosphatase n=1 Tax=Chitinivorax sp. B TaxID=2502235 RepID=UPI0010F6A205|nr:phosphoglycolate phosphatase [Chitinivorax sp. B]